METLFDYGDGKQGFRFYDVDIKKNRLLIDCRFLSPTNAKIGFRMRQLVQPDQPGPNDKIVEVAGQSYTVLRERVVIDDALRIAEDPWVWRCIFELHGGAALVEVTVLEEGQDKATDRIPIGAPVDKESKAHVINRTTPRLVLALNTTPLDPGKAGADSIKEILEHIWKRLIGGLTGAWLGPDGFRGLPLDVAGFSDEERAEEGWARQISEMLVGIPYGGSRLAYAKRSPDGPLYRKMLEPGGPYPLVAACQQLCTMGLISRGFTEGDFHPIDSKGETWGVNAGGSESLPMFRGAKRKGTWKKADNLREVDVALAVDGPGPVRQGSLYEFNVPPPNSDGSHIAFVLRIHPPEPGEDAWHGIQFLDTGAVQLQRRAPVPLVSNEGQGGNYDNPWHVDKEWIRGPKAFTGTGVLDPPDYGTLKAAVERMRRAWPLGLARLAFYERGSGKLLYATPMLRMNTEKEYENFSLARLAWSLRNMPGRETILAKWYTYYPPFQTQPLTGMWDYGRTTKVSKLFDDLGTEVRTHRGILVKPDGTVFIEKGRTEDPLKDYPPDKPAGTQQPEDIPKYFTGA